MSGQTCWTGALGLLLFVMISTTSAQSGVTEDIDDMLAVESLAPAAPQAEAVPAGEPMTGVAAGVPAAVPATGAAWDVESLQVENARLRALVAEQEARHAADMQRLYYNMGCAYRAARLYVRAETEFLRALAMNPDDPAVHYNLGILYDDDLNRHDKARYHYTRFLELSPADRDSQQVRVWLASLIP